MKKSNLKIHVIAVFLVTFVCQVVAAVVAPVVVHHHGEHPPMSEAVAYQAGANADVVCCETECSLEGDCALMHAVAVVGDEQPGVVFDARVPAVAEHNPGPPSRPATPLLRPPILSA